MYKKSHRKTTFKRHCTNLRYNYSLNHFRTVKVDVREQQMVDNS